MSSRHLVDPELLAALDALPPFDYSSEGLERTRELVRRIEDEAAAATQPRAEVECTEYRVSGRAGAPDVRVLVYRPKNARAAYRYCCTYTVAGS